MSVNGKRVPLLLVAIVLVAATIIPVLRTNPVSALDITERSLTLQAGTTDSDSDGIPDGGSQPGGVVQHKFDFDVPSTTAIGSIKFQYCTTASGTCTTPTGLVTANATLAGEVGLAGFTVVADPGGAPAGVEGSPYLTRGTATAPPADGILSYTLGSITNPTTTNQTFFVRITTYSGTDGATGAIDDGTVAASTATQIELSGVMPESLIFCTGGTVDVNVSGNPDCSTATTGDVAFDILFSSEDTATAISQMAASTNATGGYSITVNGPTLTSGSNTIDPMDDVTTPDGPSAESVSQFGMNLVLNTTTLDSQDSPLGQDVAPGFDAAENLIGQPAAGYGTDDNFRFVSGENVATSIGPTNSQIFTVSYIVNVPGSQPAGTYTTTLTYICTPTF